MSNSYQPVTILSSYITQFGELYNWSLEDLMTQAVTGVLEKSELEPQAIDAIFVANMAAGSFNNQRHLNALASQILGTYPPAVRVEAACASGGLAVLMAQQALYTGLYNTVLVLGVEKMTDVNTATTTEILMSASNIVKEWGATFPGLYALLAKAHMEQFGTTREQLSAVAVQNHQHAHQYNSKAQFTNLLTIEQVSFSQLVADPLRLLDCSPISDGASALILTNRKIKGKPRIIGFGQGQDSVTLAQRKTWTSLPATQKAAAQAYQMAGVKPEQIEVAEVHDCFTIAQLLAIEDLGFVEVGQAGSAILNGQTTSGGKLVINPSGGLKASGHPVGATGIKQVAFLADLVASDQYQLALSHNVGGSGATAVVNIISKSSKFNTK